MEELSEEVSYFDGVIDLQSRGECRGEDEFALDLTREIAEAGGPVVTAKIVQPP